MTFIDQTAVALREKLITGDTTSLELTKAYLDRIDVHDGRIGAFLHTMRDEALAQAEDVDHRRREGKPVGPLAGLPVAVKDNMCLAGQPTTCASKMLETFRPPYDATVIAKLKAADAVLIGKTNMDEFAMGASTETSALGDTRNPWDVDRIPGGSSGGAAAAVAAAMTPLSVGSDTGGSIRQPASLCGVTGLKPTYGRVSRYGLIAFASSLDQIGPFAKTAEDCALLLETLAGYDPVDSTSLNQPVPAYTESIDRPLEGLKLGVIREHFGEGLDTDVEKSVREAIAVYESLGAEIRELSLPNMKYAVAAYYLIAPSEASSNLARYDGIHYGRRSDVPTIAAELSAERKELQAAGDSVGIRHLDNSLIRLYRKSRSEAFGDEVKRRIMLGTYALSSGYYDAYYLKALKVRRLIQQDVIAAFNEVDLLVGPVSPVPAYPIGDKTDDPLAMYMLDLYTTSTNLAGNAAMSIPCGLTSKGLPIGLHLQAPPLEEERLLRGAHMFQKATDWHTKRPKGF
jgi:aspartyl-tRNA(Asn)/glutamyl-tRNA(Gln) amidotransferase subunit A